MQINFKKLQFIVFPFLLVALIVLIVSNNYTPGTWLSGWDVLHPEFDFKLAVYRAFYGVWRDDQGVGALAVHSHMADLPRILFLWFSSLFLEQSFIRYFFFFITLLIGPLGIYFFASEVFSGKDGKGVKIYSVAFLSALFYLLNFATLQHYYVPFEMFAAEYAVLPWIFLLSFKYLKHGGKRYLLWLLLASFLGSAMAYAATLFYAVFIALALFVFGYLLISRERKNRLRRSIVLLLVVVSANLFWILPNLYSISRQSQVVENAQINRTFSEEAFLSNRAYGDLRNVLTFKNHLFSWREYDTPDGKFVDLLDEWNYHLSRGPEEFYLNLISVMVLLGGALALIRRNKASLAFLPVTILSLFFLINENPPFEAIYSYLRANYGVFSESLRMPYTKFSLLFLLSSSVYFGYFFHFLFIRIFYIKNRLFRSIFYLFLLIFPMFLLSEINEPALDGNLISPSMRTQIPSEYFQFYEWMKGKPGRIAKLPLFTPYGWTYYSWDYEGAGFFPFGLENPTLDRDFDRWSAFNESFYNEASFALYNEDRESFEKVLKKYQVSYLLVDRSIINAGGENNILAIPQTEKLISESIDINKIRSFGFLDLYQVNYEVADSYVWAPDNYSLINVDNTYSQIDRAYSTYGDYIVAGGVSFPFSNLDNRAGVNIWEEYDGIHISKKINLEEKQNVIVPPFGVGNLPVGIYSEYELSGLLRLKFSLQPPKILINSREYKSQEYSQVHEFKVNTQPKFIAIDDEVFSLEDLVVGEEKLLGYIDQVNNGEVRVSVYSDAVDVPELPETLTALNPRLCSDPNKLLKLQINGNELGIPTTSDAACFGFDFGVVKESLFVFDFKIRTESGMVDFCITEDGKQKCLDSYLPAAFLGEDNKWKVFSIPMSLGTGEHFMDFIAVNNSGNVETVSNIKDFKVSAYELTEQVYYPISNNFPVDSLKENVIKEVKIDELELIYPYKNVYRENFALGRGNEEANNCDTQKKGQVYKGNNGISVVYRAENGGASCDYFDYPQIKNSQGYLLNIKGKNTEGRSMKVYLNDRLHGKSYLEVLLPKNGFNEFYAVLPRTETFPKEKNGYTLNVETRAFSNISSENAIEEIKLIPFPHEWLTGIRVQATTQDSEPESNKLSIESVKKIGTYKYLVNVDGSEFGGLIALSQGFDDGWIGYIDNGLFSSVLTGNYLKHTKLNSWANAWIVPEDACKDSCRVVIVFWPQYLEFAGFVLLAASLIYLTLAFVVDKRRGQAIK